VHLFTLIQCELVATVRIASKNPIHCCQQFLPTPYKDRPTLSLSSGGAN